MPVKFSNPYTRSIASMYPFKKINQLGPNLHYVCDKCHKQYAQTHYYSRPPAFLDIVRDINSLRESGGLEDQAYRDLISYVISIHVLKEIEAGLTQKLDEALCEKLSPDNLFEALA